MNRNTESHFANSPTLGISRSKFDRSFDHKTTFNTGDLIPIFCDTTIMPGDTVKMRMSEVVRMMTPIAPVMDNANLDIYFFFVPYRLIWEHFKRMMGENDTAPWAQTQEYTIPQIAFPNSTEGGGTVGWKKGDLADYFGYPTKIGDADGTIQASALPFRAYCAIWNEWFRDENLQNPVNVEANKDALAYGVSGTYASFDEVLHTVRGGKPLKACKYYDYFTGCLPQPQKGAPVFIPLGSTAPVIFGEPKEPYTTKDSTKAIDGTTDMLGKKVGVFNSAGEDSDIFSNMYLADVGTANSYMGTNTSLSLVTDLSNAVGATVNQLRQAFAIQKFYERQALGG